MTRPPFLDRRVDPRPFLALVVLTVGAIVFVAVAKGADERIIRPVEYREESPVLAEAPDFEVVWYFVSALAYERGKWRECGSELISAAFTTDDPVTRHPVTLMVPGCSAHRAHRYLLLCNYPRRSKILYRCEVAI